MGLEYIYKVKISGQLVLCELFAFGPKRAWNCFMVTAKLHLWPTFYHKRQIFKGVRRVASAWPVAHSARAWDAAAWAGDRVLTSPPRLGRLMARACVLFIVCVWNWINNFSPPTLHSPLHALNLLHTTIARLPVLSSSETQRRTLSTISLRMAQILFILAEKNTGDQLPENFRNGK